MITAATFQYLDELAANNNKAWFDANRKRYEAARADFEQLIAELIGVFGNQEDFGAVTPKDCMFRINRDVRFAKDKSPYNAHLAAAVGRGGRHGMGRSYYLMLAPHDRSFFAAGLYEPSAEQLDNVRRHLAQDAKPLRKIIAAPDFVRYFGQLNGDQLKTAPAGYDRGHPNIDLIRYKQHLAMHPLPDALVLSDGLVADLDAARAAMQPFLGYLDKAASTDSVYLR